MKLPTESLMSFNKQLINDLLARDITLVAVTKNKPATAIKELIKLGVKHIGENKVQEFEEKYHEVKAFLDENKENKTVNDIKFHFIGHLQSNKVKKAVEMFDIIQSIDSVKIAEKINDACKEVVDEFGKSKKIDVMIQVNIGKEEQKYGIMPEDVFDFYNKIKHFEQQNLNIIGLMCIAPDVPAEETRTYFQQMKELFDKINKTIKEDNQKITELSMGMTNDYWVALEEGSTMVRLGRILYTSFDYCCSG